MKLEIEGKEYDLNITAAKTFGCLTKLHDPIEDFKVGDVFKGEYTAYIVILPYGWYNEFDRNAEERFFFGGNCGFILSPFSTPHMNRQGVINYLREHNARFIKNVNPSFLVDKQ